MIRTGGAAFPSPLPASGFHDCSDRTSFGSVDAFVCDLVDDSWEDYLDMMGVRTAMIETLRDAPVQRVAVLRGLEVNPDDRGEGHGHRMMANLLDSFDDLGANITFLFADMEECNDFDLTEWYAGYGFERVDNDEAAPCMMIASPEIIAEVRAANAFGKINELEPCMM
ncbi:hypothetical protein ACGYLO_11565 [Sulfitobacter sp. 1A13353]|uniref:hypothetical protein n=1 Tax=Sulfitobacter sp. 1A13353 TaxID=3368568 RepID=UPI0037455FB9